MSYEKEEDKRSEINWDRLGGEGVRVQARIICFFKRGCRYNDSEVELCNSPKITHLFPRKFFLTKLKFYY